MVESTVLWSFAPIFLRSATALSTLSLFVSGVSTRRTCTNETSSSSSSSSSPSCSLRGPDVHAVLHVLAILHPGDKLVHARILFLPLLQMRRRLRPGRGMVLLVHFLPALHETDVLDAQLVADSDNVSHWVDGVLRVDNIVILKGAHHVHDAINTL